MAESSNVVQMDQDMAQVRNTDLILHIILPTTITLLPRSSKRFSFRNTECGYYIEILGGLNFCT